MKAFYYSFFVFWLVFICYSVIRAILIKNIEPYSFEDIAINLLTLIASLASATWIYVIATGGDK